MISYYEHMCSPTDITTLQLSQLSRQWLSSSWLVYMLTGSLKSSSYVLQTAENWELEGDLRKPLISKLYWHSCPWMELWKKKNRLY